MWTPGLDADTLKAEIEDKVLKWLCVVSISRIDIHVPRARDKTLLCIIAYWNSPLVSIDIIRRPMEYVFLLWHWRLVSSFIINNLCTNTVKAVFELATLSNKYVFACTMSITQQMNKSIWHKLSICVRYIEKLMHNILFRCVSFLTHWGRVTHICVSELTIIVSDNGLSPGRRQAIIQTKAGLLLIGPLGTHFSEISIGIQTFSFKKMNLNMSSGNGGHFVSASMC